MGRAPLVGPGDGAVTVPPRPSATMCVLHQTEQGIEVLMVRRSSGNRFMPGAWVFPGGVVDGADHDTGNGTLITGAESPALVPWLVAGFREVVEETGIWLTDQAEPSAADRSDVLAMARSRGLRFPADRTAFFARWITPSALPVRFDARFILVAVDQAITAAPDGRELDAAIYIAPGEALHRAAAGKWNVPFPTQQVLKRLCGFESADAAVERWRRREVVAIEPRLRIGKDGAVEILMPDDEGFEALAEDPPDPELLRKTAGTAVVRRGQAAKVAADDD